jgi:hypothetical protein
MSKAKYIITGLIVIILLLAGGIIWLYQQTPGAVGLPNFPWPDKRDDDERISCGGSLTCPEGYTCRYDQGAELGTCKKNSKKVPVKITCGGIAGLECPEGYYCDWREEVGTSDRSGECKQNKK